MNGKQSLYTVAGFLTCALFFHQWQRQGLELPGIIITLAGFLAAGSVPERAAK